MSAVVFATTALFVPGDRPDRFEKARASGAAVVIVDLEDAVAGSGKTRARRSVADALSAGLPCVVRVNGADSPHLAADLDGLGADAGGPNLLGIMLAKTESREDLERVTLANVPLIPLIESARGIEASSEIAGHPRVVRLALGGHDLAADVGISAGSNTMSVMRSRLVVASRIAGLPAPWDSPSTNLGDPEAVFREAREARDDGYGGKLCIHPSQITPTERAFQPTDAERAWAERVIGAGGGAVRIDGEMVDRPVVLRAERILRSVRS